MEIVYIQLSKKKKKKNGTCFLREVSLLWDRTHPSPPPPQSRSVKKGGGATRSILTVQPWITG